MWVAYQNKTTTDGSDGGAGYGATSTIVEYSLDGKTVVATYSVPGHSDGMRVNAATHKVWVSSNEDANARLFAIDTTASDASTAVTEYTVTGLTHGGGIDDLQFVNGKFYVACSNPANPGTHVPAVGTFTIANTTATFSPVFYDDDHAIPVGSDAATTALSLSDPDSFAIDSQGRLVSISQADNQLIWLTPIGDAGAVSLTVLTAPTQLEDTVWVTGTAGQLLVVDATANTITRSRPPSRPELSIRRRRTTRRFLEFSPRSIQRQARSRRKSLVSESRRDWSISPERRAVANTRRRRGRGARNQGKSHGTGSQMPQAQTASSPCSSPVHPPEYRQVIGVAQSVPQRGRSGGPQAFVRSSHRRMLDGLATAVH